MKTYVNILKTIEIQRKYQGDKSLSVEHTLHVQTEGYQEPHNEAVSQSPSRPSPSAGFELRNFNFCVLHAMPLCQAPHIKNKNVIVIYIARTY